MTRRQWLKKQVAVGRIGQESQENKWLAHLGACLREASVTREMQVAGKWSNGRDRRQLSVETSLWQLHQRLIWQKEEILTDPFLTPRGKSSMRSTYVLLDGQHVETVTTTQCLEHMSGRPTGNFASSNGGSCSCKPSVGKVKGRKDHPTQKRGRKTNLQSEAEDGRDGAESLLLS